MKEATGELNITVITIVAIAALAAFFYLLIWPGIQQSMALTSACNASQGFDYEAGTEDEGHITCEGGSCTWSKTGSNPVTKECAKSSGTAR